MRRCLVILLMVCAIGVVADDFVDDVYFTPQEQLRKQLENPQNLTPYYNKNAKEIIFLTDTVANPTPDTVRVIIRETP